jgi:flagellar motor protein MotB
MKKEAPPEEKGETAPLWIISFADMISLLMAFFIMLLTMATAKSGKLCNEGEMFEQSLIGFRRTISSFGLPGLLGNPDDSLYFNSRRVTYNVSNGDNALSTRTIDAEKERIQRIFNNLDKMAKALPSHLQGGRPQFTITPITFARGQSILDESAGQFLDKFAADLQQARSINGLTVYVLGLTRDDTNDKQQWILAAQRAQTAAERIKAALPADSKVLVCSWGCGKSSDFADIGSTALKQATILIGTLQTE